mgnify:CR=1 FL=1
MVYSFSSKNRGNKFLDIEFIIEGIDSTEFDIQLPAWRPGRYELANFAKNIQKLDVKTINNKLVNFEKITKDRWRVYCGNNKKIKINYNYYANELNAGTSWVDENQIYVNPVNCCFYVVGRENESIKLNFKKSRHEKTAIGLPKKDGFYIAENFDQLADSPFILSNHIQHNSYHVKGVKFNLWFQGECRPPWKKLLRDFKKFTKEQLKVFGSFPFEEYHFIFQILPYKAYHGVEHKNNTVISFGPGYSAFEGENYEELLGVASHELFHAWNVKTIRPSDMFPYDFTKENYTKMGYLTEGFTTYYGDLMLKRSGVFTTEQYLKQLNKILDRHFSNYGTQNLSVADSSFDTWLDGYERGIPNRKSSIYIEGCLLAMLLDLNIRNKSKHKKSLDKLMEILFKEYAKKGIGVSETDIKVEIKKLTGIEFNKLWDDFFHGTNDIYLPLKRQLHLLGIDISKKKNSKALAANYGVYVEPGNSIILFIAPNSPAEKAGINPGDIIIAVNNVEIKLDNADEWAGYFSGRIKLTLKKDGAITECKLNPSSKLFFPKVKLALPKPNSELKKWLKTL